MSVIKPKRHPRTNEIWTRTGMLINPLNVTPASVNVKDGLNAMSMQPMFGGMTVVFYSKAEHCINIHNLIVCYLDEYLKRHKVDEGELRLKDLRLLSLIHLIPNAYLHALDGSFAWENHLSRIRFSLLGSLGLNRSIYEMAEKIIASADCDARESHYEEFYQKRDADYSNYYPEKVRVAWLSLYNKCVPDGLRLNNY